MSCMHAHDIMLSWEVITCNCAVCRYSVNSIPLEEEGIIRDMRFDYWPWDLQTKIGQWHDLLMVLYLIDPTRPIGDLDPKIIQK